MRRLWTALSFVALCAASMADFTGPMPIAWKWQQTSTAVPGPVDSANGVVFAGVGGRVYAVDAVSGAQLWRFPAAEALTNNFREGVTVHNGFVVAPADNGIVYGLNAQTGERAWQFSGGAQVIEQPKVSGDSVVLRMADSTLQVVNAKTGEAAWSEPYKVTDNIMGETAVTDRLIVYATDTNNLVGLDILTRKPKFSVRFSELEVNCVPVIHNEVAYVVSGQFIIGVELASGRARVNINCREDIVQPPAISDRSFTIATEDGRIRTVNGQGRDIHKPIELLSRAINPPVFTGRLVTVNTSNGNMNVIDPATGEILWTWVQRPLMKPKAGTDGKTPPNYMGAAASAKLVGNTLLLLSRDGGLSAFDSQIGVDLTAPNVSMIWPTPGNELNPNLVGGGMIDCFWQIDDPSTGIKPTTLKVEANGKALKHVMTSDGVLYVRFSEQGNFPGYGRVSFTVTAADWLGNLDKKTFVLTLDSTLKLTPKPGATLTGGTAAGGGRPGAGSGSGGGSGGID